MDVLSQAEPLGGLHRASLVPFRGSFFTPRVHPLGATPQRLIAYLYRLWDFPSIPSPRFVAHAHAALPPHCRRQPRLAPSARLDRPGASTAGPCASATRPSRLTIIHAPPGGRERTGPTPPTAVVAADLPRRCREDLWCTGLAWIATISPARKRLCESRCRSGVSANLPYGWGQIIVQISQIRSSSHGASTSPWTSLGRFTSLASHGGSQVSESAPNAGADVWGISA
jgi:hypothetical protein